MKSENLPLNHPTLILKVLNNTATTEASVPKAIFSLLQGDYILIERMEDTIWGVLGRLRTLTLP